MMQPLEEGSSDMSIRAPIARENIPFSWYRLNNRYRLVWSAEQDSFGYIIRGTDGKVTLLNTDIYEDAIRFLYKLVPVKQKVMAEMQHVLDLVDLLLYINDVPRVNQQLFDLAGIAFGIIEETTNNDDDDESE